MPTGEKPRESYLLQTPLYQVTGRGSKRPVKIILLDKRAYARSTSQVPIYNRCKKP